MNTDNLAELIHLRGIEELKRYYGVYRATVVDIKDPLKRGRVMVKVPVMGHLNEINVWIDPSCYGAGPNRGMFWTPAVGDPVRVTFERGDSGHPVLYISGWHGINDMPSEFAYSDNGEPEKKGFVTRLGHRLLFSDSPNSEYVHLSCHFPDATDKALTDSSVSADRTTGKTSFIDFSSTGLNISNQNGSLISLDAENNAITIIDENGNTVSLNKNGMTLIDKGGQTIFMDGKSINITSEKSVTVSAGTVNLNSGSVFLGQNASFSSVLGELMIAYIAAHTHGVVAPGTPTTPPIIPPTKALLSSNVKLGV